MTGSTLTSPGVSSTTPAHVCTIRSSSVARMVLVSLVAIAVMGGAWLAAAMLSGPWLADSLVVEAIVAGIVLLSGAFLAISLSRALGCGHCHTPKCTCS